MRDLIFCSRCRGMEVGWNRAYVRHRFVCGGVAARSLRFSGVFAAVLVALVLLPVRASAPAAPEARLVAGLPVTRANPESGVVDPTVAAVEDLLGRHTNASAPVRQRIARAVVESGRRHGVDPFLVTGVLVAESSGNPYAVSNRQAVGIMQIHVPTWGETAETEGLNLFLLEDNIELGVRILEDYTSRYGRRGGVMRYLGVAEATPQALAYVQRVEGIYSERQAD